VLAYNEATGQTSSYEVTATHAHEDPLTVNLTIGGELLETTLEHPFYTADEEWVAAGDLEVGDDIRRADGSYGEVEAIEFIQQPQVMYNLTVDEAHTFFVGDGQWLVHNDCGYPGFGELGWTNYQRHPQGLSPGIYEYHSWGDENGPIYVGMTYSESIVSRLRVKQSSYGRNLDNVFYSAIDFNGDRHAAEVAERIRIEQLMADPNVGPYRIVNVRSGGIFNTATRQEAIEFMARGAYRDYHGWPDWLRLPENMVPGWD
jgi:hypothetical protein